MRFSLLLFNICMLFFFSNVHASDYSEGTMGGDIPAVTPPASVGSQPQIVLFKVSAEKTDANLETATTQFKTLQGILKPAMMTSTGAILTEIETAYTTYKESKKACVEAADTSETMCIESKSSGAKIAKGIIDSSGPIIAALASAQEACSSTAEMADMAGKAVTAAKGACVGAKLLCDNSCSKAAAELAAISTKFTALFAMAQKEMPLLVFEYYCSPMPVNPSPVCPALLKVTPALTTFNSSVPPLFKAEAAAEPIGTVGSFVKTCTGYSKDVGLFALNAVNLYQANKSAQACADQLGSGGTAPSLAQYCAVAINMTTTVCKCQKDNTAEGCPGYISKTAGTNPPTDDAGNNLKNAGTGNQFAGGSPSIKPNAIDIGKLNSDSTTAADDGKNPDPVVKTNDNPGGGSVNSSPSGSGSGNVSAKDAQGSDDKKKFSLGAFLGFGGSGASGSGAGKGANGALGKKDIDAVQRQIASEKLRAEISGASGKSNWEKVNERYLRNTTSLLVGQ